MSGCYVEMGLIDFYENRNRFARLGVLESIGKSDLHLVFSIFELGSFRVV